MNLNHAQINALRALAQGPIERPMGKWIRADTMRGLVRLGLAEWKNFAGMRGGYTITSEGRKALEAGR